jgi:hypothetical protein
MKPRDRPLALSASRFRVSSGGDHGVGRASRTSAASGHLGATLDAFARADAQSERMDRPKADERAREVELALLAEIAAIMARKEIGVRAKAPANWRCPVDNNLFELVMHVCEDRMQRLQQSTVRASEWIYTKDPRH